MIPIHRIIRDEREMQEKIGVHHRYLPIYRVREHQKVQPKDEAGRSIDYVVSVQIYRR